MHHPGGISGEGELNQHGKDLLRAYHDFDGCFIRDAGARYNCELSCSAKLLGAIFELASLRCEPTTAGS